MNAHKSASIETADEAAAWDNALAEHAPELEELANAVQLDIAPLPVDVNDATW